MSHRAAHKTTTTASEHRFAASGSLQVKKGHETSYNKGLSWLNVDPITAAAFGSSVDFRVANSWLVRSLYLQFDFAAITATFTGGD